MVTRRGDNIPSVADYAHWNEDAEAMWYAENRYDMEHADEIIEDDFDDRDYDEDERYDLARDFTLRLMAEAFMADMAEASLRRRPDGRWEVEYASDDLLAERLVRR